MGFIFSSNKNKDQIVAIFDIGSGSVGGAIVRIPEDKNRLPSIIKSVRTDIKFHENFDFYADFNSFLKHMVSTLDMTANSLFNTRSGAPDQIYCILASPWYLSETRTVKIFKDKPFIFTKKVADELIKKEISNLDNIYNERYGELNSTPNIIEQNIMSVSLNGYEVEDPIGKECKFVFMDMAVSLTPSICIDKIKETIARTLHTNNIQFSSFTMATYLAVKNKYVKDSSYLLIDISGELTEIGIVTKGVLKSVSSFPFGKKTFFNYICTKLNIELRDAKELFKLYSSDHLSLEYKEKVIPLFKSIENSWGESFRYCIDKLPRTFILPNTIFLTADDDIKNWFANVLQNEEHMQSTISGQKGSVITLDGQNFLDMCGVDSGYCDPFLMIESISVMRKIVK